MSEKMPKGSEEDFELREACGLFGCVATGDWPTKLDVANIIYLGLIAVQHRGQESCGITTSLDGKHTARKALGLVNHAFTEEDLLKLEGNLGIGHTRYSTQGGTDPLNTQPFEVRMIHGDLSVAHNGQLVNASQLRKKIIESGIGLSTDCDSELVVKILCQPPPSDAGKKEGPDWLARIKNLMSHTQMAYSLLIMSGDTIYAVRDPYGLRPLCLGKLVPPKGSLVEELLQMNGCSNGAGGCDGYVVASESCAFPSVGGELIRDVEPGEIVEISKHGIKSLFIMRKTPSLCVFEYVYFAKADSKMEGQMVYTVRKECGRQLAIQAPVEADIVSAVPESAIPAALGYAEQSGIKYAEVLCKNGYVGRTFIQPTTRLRQLAVLKKFGPLTDNFQNKRIVLVDDSIVRGNTMRAIISILREAGAMEVHVCIASPPLHHPCYMGINLPTREELVANRLDAGGLARELGADSLVYLSVENLLRAVEKNAAKGGGHCTACLTGKYPAELQW